MSNGRETKTDTATRGSVHSVRADATIAEAARRMRDNRGGSLLVVDDAGAVVGIITEQDIVRRSTASSANPDHTRVAEIMTRDVISVSSKASLKEAADIMSVHGVRHLPVIEGGKPVGMLSGRDIVSRQLWLTEAMKAAAEQAARLSRGLRSLEVREIIEILSTEIPRIFQARRWLLSYADAGARGRAEPLIRRQDCPCSVKNLLTRDDLAQLAKGSGSLCETIPAECKKAGCGDSRAMIPLTGTGPSDDDSDAADAPSFLCMCGLSPETLESAEVLRYKSALVRDILNVNLSNAKLYQASRRDPLTDLRTRRALEEELVEEHARSLRQGRTFSVGILDVDGFKGVNDRYGHLAGDEILLKLAETLRADVRAYDLAVRYGGDEFVVLMPETPLEGAVVVVERLRRRLEASLSTPDGKPVTVSCGVADWLGKAEDNGTDVLRRADAALYEAKQAGRNRIVTAPAPATVG